MTHDEYEVNFFSPDCDPFDGIDMFAGDDVAAPAPLTTGGLELQLDIAAINAGSVRDAAIAYHEAGLRVHPCRGKIPVGKGWQTNRFDPAHYGSESSVGAQGGPMANGRCLVIVDIDVAKVEGDTPEDRAQRLYATLETMEAEGLVLPPTLRASTPSGGCHYYYWTAENEIIGKVRPWKCATGGLDLRADGTQAVVPPSRGYQFIDPIAVLAELPEWIRERASKVKPAERPTPAPRATATGDLDKRIRAYLAKCPPAIQGSRGSDEALKAASWIVTTFPQLSDEDVVAYMEADWNATCAPPWSTKELLHKVKSARANTTRVVAEREPPPPRHLRAVPKPTEPEPRIEGNTALKPQEQERTGYGPECWVYPTLGQVSELSTRAQILWDCFKVRKNVMLNQNECVIDGKTRNVTQEEKLEIVEFLQRKMPDYYTGGEPVKASQKTSAVSEKAIDDAVCRCASIHQYNPVTDWLESLAPWDGRDYIGQLADMIGDEHFARCKAFLTRWLIGTCMRAFEPGCIMDVALWFWGNEGPGKSSLFRGLVNRREWFFELDKAVQISDRFAMFLYNTAWIVELPEVDQLRTPENRSMLKAWLTMPVDRGSPKGRPENITIERKFSVAGTTNKKVFAEGQERRWLPVHHVKKLDHAMLESIRPQLWAQVLRLYREGESYRLNATEQQWHREAISDQGETLDDSLAELILEYLDANESIKKHFMYTDLYDAMGIDASKRTDKTDARLRHVMEQFGYKRGLKTSKRIAVFYKEHNDS